MLSLAFTAIPIAVALGWYLAKKTPNKKQQVVSGLRRDYFRGLNYLINEQPDKAVDIFVKLISVDSETVETHLALGSLFRRRGEVDRAIRIHQNLIERPQLSQEHRMHALLELGKDYLNAGVLDRAENMFLELMSCGYERLVSARYLVRLYQLEKDWHKAITMAEKLAVVSGKSTRRQIAHYYCELAEKNRQSNTTDQVYFFIEKALSQDKDCVRANIIYAKVKILEGDYAAAIKSLQQVAEQNKAFIAEVMQPLLQCYAQGFDRSDLIDFLKRCLQKKPQVAIILALAECYKLEQREHEAIEFITQQIKDNPSLRCLQYLLKLYIPDTSESEQFKLNILNDLITKLLAVAPAYRCDHCGFAGNLLYWCCPGCYEWEGVRPVLGFEIR